MAFLDMKKDEISGRMSQLKPMVDEYEQLKAAADALGRIGGSAVSTTVRRGPGRPAGSGRKPGRPAGSGRKPGRPAGSGRKPGRPRATAAAATATAPAAKRATRTSSRGSRVGRRKGSGARSVQALGFVTSQPGITIPELAAKMGIKQNYLYRVLPGLEQEGKVRKEGRGWLPA